MYVVELSLKLSPMPVAVQRKEQSAAEALYGQVRQALESGHPRLLELTYEKSAIGGGSKRPGFSFDG